tara:strand:+ start:1940 stop:2476 length:537 start_codon:yes stop_codon:yes gene_type:complete
MNRLTHYLPLALFIVLVLGLFTFLDREESDLRSVLLNKDFPNFSLSRLDNAEIITKDDLLELPSLLNVWATWCVACLVEHPFLMELKNEARIKIYGLNYKDDRNKALKLLDRIGDPYELSIFDKDGKLAIDLGVYGAPETFLIDNEGIIRVRHVGVLTPEVWEQKFNSVLSKLKEDEK